MGQVERRPLSERERALILRLLDRAGKARPPLDDLERLRVVAACDCGCGSIDLEPVAPTREGAEDATILADAFGAVQDGHAVGLILWGTESRVTGLEIYSLAFDPPFELPRPDSVSDVPPGFDPVR